MAVATSQSVVPLDAEPLSHLAVDWRALDTDTIARLPKEELPKDTEARPASVYQPEKPAQLSHELRSLRPSGQRTPNAQRSTLNAQRSTKSGTTFIITPGLGQEYALRFRYKNTTGEPVTARMTITDAKNSVLVDRDVTFPPTPDKFKMLSTTTGTQINAGTYRLRIDTKDIEFKEVEVQ